MQIQKTIFGKIKLFTLGFAAFSSVTLIGGCEKKEDPKTYQEVVTNFDKETSSRILLEAIIENRSMEYEDKNLFKGVANYLEENESLTEENTEKLYERMSTLNMYDSKEYEKKVDNFEMAKANTNCFYDRNSNSIYVVNEDCPQYDKQHEFYHVLGNLYQEKAGIVFNEGLCLILNDEYNNGGIPSGYCLEKTNATRILTQIVGRDTIVEAFTDEDFSVIESKLVEVAPKIAPKDFLQANAYMVEKREMKEDSVESEEALALYKRYVDYYAMQLGEEKAQIINGYMDNIITRTENFQYPCFSKELMNVNTKTL